MKIAIIGGGFSGLTAAYLLNKKNHEVTLFEKEETLGGHCYSLGDLRQATDLGTSFCLPRYIKPLFVELGIDYSERFVYRNFLNEKYEQVQQLDQSGVRELLDELNRLDDLLAPHKALLQSPHYGKIPEDLLEPLCPYLNSHGLSRVCQVLAPHLAAFGFGNIYTLPAYYAFKIFDKATMALLIKGEKLLFFDEGTSQVINQLKKQVKDIRYGLGVRRVSYHEHGALVETEFSKEAFDRVFITCPLKGHLVGDPILNEFMNKVVTNPYFTCAYDVEEKKVATTYYNSHLGKDSLIQFFHPNRVNHQTSLVTYAYGKYDRSMVDRITQDIKNAGIHPKYLIMTKQWEVFPHVPLAALSQDTYHDLLTYQANRPIQLLGSLISHPSMADLYASVKASVEAIG